MIARGILIASIGALAGCSDAGGNAPVVESEVVAPTPADAESIEPSDRSLADPAQDSVTAPANPATRTPDEDTPAPSDLGDEYQDYVEDQVG